MMDGIGDAIASAFIAMIVAAFIVGVGIACFFIFGVPWLWRLLKPLLHTWTA